jgi:hypothetical protein
MEISGLGDRTMAELEEDVRQGGRFVVYSFTVSVIILTFKRSSGLIYVPSEKNRFVQGLSYSFITLMLGWWGIPWGPIYTVGSLITNFGGGKDVTEELLAQMQAAMIGNSSFSDSEI